MFSPLLNNVTVLDLALPGTHDTFTYDLSLIVSDGADDGSEDLSLILHLASEMGIVPTEWIRNQSSTQGLNITQQLDIGVRFIDFRIMYTSGDWYCLHFMQTNNKVIFYLNQIKNWLLQHPQEIIVIWFSKHGNPCATGDNQYPGVSIEIKQQFWKLIEQTLGDLIINVKQYPLNETTIAHLIQQNHRVAIYASDYVQFTNSSPNAMDGCDVDNNLCESIDDEASSIQCLTKVFSSAAATLKKDKSLNKFFLLSMASSASGSELIDSFLGKYLDPNFFLPQCSRSFNIPNMTNWCPPHLLDISQLTNYYNQIAFESVWVNQWDYPNAIYIDAVDLDGTIRTGTQILQNQSQDTQLTRYAYVSNILLYNLQKACGSDNTGQCLTLKNLLSTNRSLYPIQRWDDPSYGRLMTWPLSYD